jgi:hypothetical protein
MARRFRSVLAMEGELTGDGRLIAPNALLWETPPIPLLWQENTADGHDTAEVVAVIDMIERRGTQIYAEGRLLEEHPERYRIEEMIREGVINPSIDPDDVVFEIDETDPENVVFVMTQARIRAATLVATQAILSTTIELIDEVPVVEVPQQGGEASVVEVILADGAPEPTAQQALVASGAPSRPPAAWFAQPELSGPTPLTIDDDGRVWGHLAAWGTCHTGYPDTCTTAPPSASGYAYFHTGEVLTEEGERVATGRITVGGGHAGPGLGYRAALAHYDDAGAAAADVVAGEDQWGIWLAGAMRAELPESTVHALRANPPSGDWRRINGSLELMAALSVNLQGFPIPRPRFAAKGGVQTSLVAAGALRPSDGAEPVVTHSAVGPDESLVAAVLARLEQRDAAERLAVSVGRDRATLAATLAADVKGI